MLNLSHISWVTIPRLGGRVSKSLFNTLIDGYFLVSFRSIASYINIIVFLSGLAIGVFRLGFQYIYTENLFLLMLFFGIGAFSGRLGLSLLLGFMAGLIYSHHQWHWKSYDFKANTLYIASYLLEFILIYLGTTQISGFVKNLIASSIDVKKYNKKTLTVILILMYLILINGVIYIWSQTLPLFLRSIFLWRNENLVEKVFKPLQFEWIYLSIAVSVATLFRLYLQISTQKVEQSLAYLKLYEQKIAIDFKKQKPLFERVPIVIKNTFSALLITFIASGLFLKFQDAIIYFFVMLAFYFLRNFISHRTLLEKWNKILGFVPFGFRLSLAFVLTYVIIRALMPVLYQKIGQTTFWPVILSSFIGMIIYLLLIPPRKE